MTLPNFPFIIGSGRSGTTLLRAMFDSHPDMAIPFESYFVADMAMVKDRYHEGGVFDPDHYVNDMLGYYRFQRWELPEDQVRDRYAKEAPPDFADAVRLAYRMYAEAQGKSRYGDKTPRYVTTVPVLAETFPESIFIHIIRDGRNVALSYLEMEWGPDNLKKAAKKWKERVEVGRRDGGALGPRRYTEIRYEDLVGDPEGEMARLADFVGIEIHPAMFRYYERADEIRKGANYPHRHQHISKPPTKNLRDWRTIMSDEDIELFDGIAGDLLHELGYEN